VAAQRAVSTETSEREGRLADVEAELGRLATLRDHAMELSPDLVLARQ
jgi:hypothetical protein